MSRIVILRAYVRGRKFSVYIRSILLLLLLLFLIFGLAGASLYAYMVCLYTLTKHARICCNALLSHRNEETEYAEGK